MYLHTDLNWFSCPLLGKEECQIISCFSSALSKKWFWQLLCFVQSLFFFNQMKRLTEYWKWSCPIGITERAVIKKCSLVSINSLKCYSCNTRQPCLSERQQTIFFRGWHTIFKLAESTVNYVATCGSFECISPLNTVSNLWPKIQWI